MDRKLLERGALNLHENNKENASKRQFSAPRQFKSNSQ